MSQAMHSGSVPPTHTPSGLASALQPPLRATGLALLASLLAACGAERATQPAESGVLGPALARAVEASGYRGPVALLKVRGRDGRERTVLPLGNPDGGVRLRGGGPGLALEASGAAPDVTTLDFEDDELAFIVQPGGGRNIFDPNNEGNRIALTHFFFCPVGETWVQLRQVRINSIVQRSLPGTGGHGTAHQGVKPVGTHQPTSGVTDQNGFFHETYTANIASGDEYLDVDFTVLEPGPCQGIREVLRYQSAVRYPGLVELESNDDIIFGQISSDHPSLWYGTPALNSMVALTAENYRENFKRRLVITAMSLPYGGINDINRNWTNPHNTHRAGTDVDLDGANNSKPEHDKLKKAGVFGGGFTRCQVDNGNHVHCFSRRYFNTIPGTEP